MKLETPRLKLRKFAVEDLEDVHQLHTDPAVMKYVSTPMYTHRMQSEDFIAMQLHYYRTREGLGIWPAFKKDTGEFIGWYALKYLQDSQYVEIGYRLHQKYWGQGFATEGSKQILLYGLETLGLPQIVALIHPDNGASRRVLEKIGLEFLRNDYYYDTEVEFFEIKRSQGHPLQTR